MRDGAEPVGGRMDTHTQKTLETLVLASEEG